MTAAAGALRPWLTLPAWGLCLALLVLAPLFPAFALRVQYVPFALGLLLLGLPHGAMDHLAVPRLERRPLTIRFALPFFAAYLGLVLLYLSFWRAAPAAALAVFIVLSCLHWGQGDLAYLRLFEGRPRPRGLLPVLTVWLVRGGLPILLPILAFPATFARVAAGLTAWYGGAGLPPPGRGVAMAGMSALLALVCCYVRCSWRDYGPARRDGFRRDMGELALLAALFAFVPPVLAVGTYFCVWHSARHVGRLMLADPVTADLLARGRMGRGAGRTITQSLPLTVAALALLAGLYAAQAHHGNVGSLSGLVLLYLSLIAALTVPHFLVVLWMDRLQHISWVTSNNGRRGKDDAMTDDEEYSNEVPSGPTLEQLAGTGHGPPGGGDVPATGVASAPGGGTIDAALVGTSTEVLGAGSDGGEAGDGGENDLDVDAVTGTGAGAGTGELDTMQTGTAQTDGGEGGNGGLDTSHEPAPMSPAPSPSVT